MSDSWTLSLPPIAVKEIIASSRQYFEIPITGFARGMRHYPHNGVGFVPPLGEFLKVIPLSYVADASASVSVCHLSVVEGKGALVHVEEVCM